MLKKLAGCVREYKKPSILTLIFIVGEVIIECIIPFLTADLVNSFTEDNGDISRVYILMPKTVPKSLYPIIFPVMVEPVMETKSPYSSTPPDT